MIKQSIYIEKYLNNRPMFLAVIRTPEALLFQKHSRLIKKPILDFGCGDGFFCETVFGKEKINIGLDIKNERTEKIINKKIYKKIVLYNGKKLPFKDNYFQTIVSNCVLEHILNIDYSLKEIYRVLKPDGYFITTVMTDKWNDYLLGKKLLGNYYVNYMRRKQTHHHLFSYQRWTNLFKKTGFKIIKAVGYLNEKNSCFMDLSHYLSLLSLITYQLFNNWQIFPRLNIFLWKNFITKNINIRVNVKKSSALFFCLYKQTESKEF